MRRRELLIAEAGSCWATFVMAHHLCENCPYRFEKWAISATEVYFRGVRKTQIHPLRLAPFHFPSRKPGSLLQCATLYVPSTSMLMLIRAPHGFSAEFVYTRMTAKTRFARITPKRRKATKWLRARAENRLSIFLRASCSIAWLNSELLGPRPPIRVKASLFNIPTGIKHRRLKPRSCGRLDLFPRLAGTEQREGAYGLVPVGRQQRSGVPQVRTRL